MARATDRHSSLFSYLDNDGEIDEHVFFAEQVQPHEELLVVLLVTMCDHLKGNKVRFKFNLILLNSSDLLKMQEFQIGNAQMSREVEKD